MKRLAAVARFVVGLFVLALVLLLSVSTGRSSVLFLGVTSLVALSVLRRTRPLWIAPMWRMVIPLGVALVVFSVDVKFSSSFPTGVWVRPYVYGLLSDGLPRDVTGVPDFYWTGSCIGIGNEPEWVLVVGLGGSRKAMAEEYRHSAPDAEVKDQIREAASAYEAYFADQGTYAGLDLGESEWFEAADCIAVEAEGKEDFYVIRGSHCDSPHVFEMTTDFTLPESGKVVRVE